MKFKVKDKEFVKFMQEGGVAPEAAPVEEAPAAPEQGGSPEEQLLMACQQALQTQDCNLAMQVCQAILQMMGGGAEEAAPAAPEGQQPVYKKGGKLSKWVSK